jgi:hypothetical protein
VIAAPDDDPHADPVPRLVKEIFENYLPTLDLHMCVSNLIDVKSANSAQLI